MKEKRRQMRKITHGLATAPVAAAADTVAARTLLKTERAKEGEKKVRKDERWSLIASGTTRRE